MWKWSLLKRNTSDSSTWEPCQVSFFFKELLFFWSAILSNLFCFDAIFFVFVFVFVYFLGCAWNLLVDFKAFLNLVLCFERSSFEKQVMAVLCRMSLLHGAVLMLCQAQVEVLGLKCRVELDSSAELIKLMGYSAWTGGIRR